MMAVARAGKKRRGAAALTLGPLYFHWPPEVRRDFYFRIADEAPVDSVCLGEVVCLKRMPFFEPYMDAVVERLRHAGKEVVFSTLALVMNAREMEAVRALAAAPDLFVEANDVSAIALLAGRQHAVGPFINVYNEGTLARLVAHGATRVCLPVELPATSLAPLAASNEAELEIHAFGRLPLAVSARCYHARYRELSKDSCQFVCADDSDGLEVETLDGVPFLAVNGTQTLSQAYYSLIAELEALRGMGIHRFRLSPQDTDMVAVARIFRDVLDGRETAAAASEDLARLVDHAPFANGFFHGREGAALAAAAME
jgi:collagenase-like PrtC family protease